MKDSYYFSHDSNARYDPKILAMISTYGMQGYGWYWVIIEILREQENYKFCIKKEHYYNAIAMQLYSDCNTIKKFIQDCINEFELFVSDGNYFWSESLLSRMQYFDEVKQRRIEAGRRGGLKTQEIKAQVKQELSNTSSNAKAELKQNSSNAKANKVNKSKVNKSKVNNNKEKENKEKENEINDNNSPNNKYSDDSVEIKLSKLLFEEIQKRDPKCRPPDFQKWAIYIDRLIRLDKREPDEIEKVILWCQQDDFWKNNILSTEKLRNQFQQLILKMNRNKKEPKSWDALREFAKSKDIDLFREKAGVINDT